MGLNVTAYRYPGIDCTNGGMSSEHDRLTLVNVGGPFNPNESSPPALLVEGPYKTPRIVPAVYDEHAKNWKEAPGWHMMGGNYAASSDGRFTEAVEAITGAPFYGAVAIHDRVE